MKPKKPKKVNVELIEPGDRSRHPLYKLLDSLVKQHHEHLLQAHIGLCWNAAWRADKDGLLVLGKCRKASDFNREFSEYDFVILLNEEAWQDLTEAQRLALLDHECCHCEADLDDAGKQKEDERGRLCWRIRKHSIEEFKEIVTRHGMYKADLADFVKAARESQATSLFPRVAAEA